MSADDPYETGFLGEIKAIHFSEIIVIITAGANGQYSNVADTPAIANADVTLTDASGQGTFNFSLGSIAGYDGPPAQNLPYTLQKGDAQTLIRYKNIVLGTGPFFPDGGGGFVQAVFPLPGSALRITATVHGQKIIQGPDTFLADASVDILIGKIIKGYKTGFVAPLSGIGTSTVAADNGVQTNALHGKLSDKGIFTLDPKKLTIVRD